MCRNKILIQYCSNPDLLYKKASVRLFFDRERAPDANQTLDKGNTEIYLKLKKLQNNHEQRRA